MNDKSNDLSNDQKEKHFTGICRKMKRQAHAQEKRRSDRRNWKRYAVFMLTGMISLSTVISVLAAAPEGADTLVSGEEQLFEPADGKMPEYDSGENAPADRTDTDVQEPDTGQNGQEPDTGQNGQGTDTGQNGQEPDAGQAAATDADSDRPKVSADIVEDEDPPKISADVIIDEEQDDHVVIAQNDKPYLALGANLNEEQKRTVLSLMGIDPASLDQYQVVTVTNEEEHQYLDGYLDASIIGTRALSSVVIVKRDKGDGIHISTKNISYCTIGMYKNALATAGLEDADVIIAGPFPLSGTAALIGAMKAYADMEDTKIDTESLDAAMNEIVVTGELNESLGEDAETEEFIAYVKQKVVEGGFKSRKKIEEVIAKACDQFEISLNEDEKEKITALMQKIGSLDIDVDSLLKQAGSIYDSIREMEESGGFLSKIAAFFKRLFASVVQFFQNLF